MPKLIFRFCFVHLPVMHFKCGMFLLVLVGGIGYCKYTKHTHAHAQASTRKHAGRSIKSGLDPGPWTLDSRLWTLDPGFCTMDSGL